MDFTNLPLRPAADEGLDSRRNTSRRRNLNKTTTTTTATTLRKIIKPEAEQQQQQQHQHQKKRRMQHRQEPSFSRAKEARANLSKGINRLIVMRSFRASEQLLICALILFAARLFQRTEAIKLQPGGSHKYYWSGEQFAITCQNTNNIKNVKIRWIGPNGQDVSEDKSAPVHAESTGPHSYRLMFMNATPKRDDGTYKCTIGSTDDRGARETKEFQLELHQATSFGNTQRHLVLPNRRQGIIDCRVEFDPSVLPTSTVSWMRDGQAIEKFNDSNIRIVEWDPSRKLTQLILEQSDKRYDGTYTCRAIAETTQLSKISDHHIVVETIYPPTFEQTSETVWVERQQQYGVGAMVRSEVQPARSRQVAGSRHRVQHQQQQEHSATNSVEHQSGDHQSIRVELHCNCQANPNASILWSLASSRFVLNRGDPAHIIDLTPTQVDGHNSSSTLVINYSLNPNWEYKRDSYICSATNQLGTAQKTFTVEQGDPPPAYRVGAQKHYDPLSHRFTFQLMGPNFENNNQREIIPPVDSFRIRAESSLVVNTGASSAAAVKRRNFEPNVQSAYSQTNQTYTLNLSKLPSGPQRLYLETHNAVGWSPNTTYLGDFNIVNGGVSSSPSSNIIQSFQLALLTLANVMLLGSLNRLWFI